jgi:hypothetical protein
MATLSFSYNTGSVPLSRIVDAMAVVYGYPVNVDDPENPGQTIPNPQTKAEFGRAVIRRIIIDAVREAELRPARVTAESSVAAIDLT